MWLRTLKGFDIKDIKRVCYILKTDLFHSYYFPLIVVAGYLYEKCTDHTNWCRKQVRVVELSSNVLTVVCFYRYFSTYLFILELMTKMSFLSCCTLIACLYIICKIPKKNNFRVLTQECLWWLDVCYILIAVCGMYNSKFWTKHIESLLWWVSTECL